MTDGGFTKNRPWRRTYVWVGMAAILVLAAIAATVWTTQVNHRADPRNDCSVVEELGSKWDKMQQSVAALERGAGETKDLLAIADAESAMAKDIRAAQASVSAPGTKTQLGNWAEGTDLTAKNQREAVTAPVNSTSAPRADSDSVRATTLVYNATAVLRKTCPNLQLSQAPQS
ncbi:hypothetical protein [Mycobacterium sp.]|uniref:hypothetical protein n=1 Tax=Mycobacterium sp. TaxID=1785 RepID=UPI0025D551FD|nr:hypothetical protein [Mycobacterium sp.]